MTMILNLENCAAAEKHVSMKLTKEQKMIISVVKSIKRTTSRNYNTDRLCGMSTDISGRYICTDSFRILQLEQSTGDTLEWLPGADHKTDLQITNLWPTNTTPCKQYDLTLKAAEDAQKRLISEYVKQTGCKRSEVLTMYTLSSTPGYSYTVNLKYMIDLLKIAGDEPTIEMQDKQVSPCFSSINLKSEYRASMLLLPIRTYPHSSALAPGSFVATLM